jgi:hypothetical protein
MPGRAHPYWIISIEDRAREGLLATAVRLGTAYGWRTFLEYFQAFEMLFEWLQVGRRRDKAWRRVRSPILGPGRSRPMVRRLRGRVERDLSG